MFLSQQTRLSRQNTSFVATKVCLPRQNVCHDKILFVAANTCFVVTKMILGAAPANDKHQPGMGIASNEKLGKKLRSFWGLWVNASTVHIHMLYPPLKNTPYRSMNTECSKAPSVPKPKWYNVPCIKQVWELFPRKNSEKNKEFLGACFCAPPLSHPHPPLHEY